MLTLKPHDEVDDQNFWEHRCADVAKMFTFKCGIVCFGWTYQLLQYLYRLDDRTITMLCFRSVLCFLCLIVYLIGKKCKKVQLIYLIPLLYIVEVCLITWEASLKLDEDKENYEAILEHTVFMRLAFVYFF